MTGVWPIEDNIVRVLKRRAAKQGRSAEAEHREILREVLSEEPNHPSFKELLLSMPDVALESDLERPRERLREAGL